jgi:hypothetical protein
VAVDWVVTVSPVVISVLVVVVDRVVADCACATEAAAESVNAAARQASFFIGLSPMIWRPQCCPTRSSPGAAAVVPCGRKLPQARIFGLSSAIVGV